MKWNCDTELSEIRKIYPQNMQYQGLMLHTDTCVYKYQNLALEEQHRDIRFERKVTVYQWTSMRVRVMGRFQGMLMGVSIIFAKCISYNLSIDNMHNGNILKWTLVS